MSCQQLIQEDPYIFTDTVSNSTSFMHENNSQTKYVPLNRQTIYNRQFRQHEPKLASITDLNNSLLKSTSYSDHNNKIVISPTTLKERKNNELNNGKILSSRASPKFFKSHQQQQVLSHNDNNGQLSSVKNNYNKNNNFTQNHSNGSVSKQQNQHHESNFDVINHVSDALENGITGIKKEKEEETSTIVDETISNNLFVKIENDKLKIEHKNCDDNDDDDDDDSDNDEKNDKSCVKKNSNKRTNRKRDRKLLCLTTLQISSRNVIVEPICEIPRHAPLVQQKLNVIDKRLLQNYRYCCNDSKRLSRDDRLSMRKIQLRHVLNQYKGINRFREVSTERYKAQLSKTFKLSKVMEREKQRILKKSIKLCSTKDCKDEAVVSTDFCAKHILSTEKEQFLIRQCCFRHLDGQQCRVPVNNILATVAVCNDHMNAPAHQLISSDSIEPKKNPVQRKRTKTSPLIRPVKKNGKGGRKKKLLSIAQSNLIMPVHRPTMIIHPSDLQKQTIKSSGNLVTSTATTLLPLKQENLHHQNDCDQFIHFNSGNLLASSQSSYGSMSSGNEDLYIKQDLMPAVCENSYESSEDTGVGGLSENELISHDVIGNFDMESCAELSKVLSSLPSNTLDDLLTEPLHTSRDDEEYLDRAIEEVSASGMDQIAITAFEHLEGLDMLEMLDDDEQRQMISAATNLISMSGYMSHDQDNNYAAMPSPMMS
ncbi:uncharacterized protein [Chironomus tepperi]|uniref:uncharacterized protein n=1 Tax=Chironomus tepperi TaxID=113505 RepID=UPI00391F5B58